MTVAASAPVAASFPALAVRGVAPAATTLPAVDVAVIGATGRVGRRVLELLARPATDGPRWRVVAAGNSRAARIDPQGLALDGLADTLALGGHDLVADAGWPALLDALAAPLIVVDCTASAAVAARYPAWLAAGIDVVTPNKLGSSADRPLASRIARAQIGGGALFDATTVGAQLPLLDTLRELERAGDRLVSLEAVLSGTLSYVLGRVQQGEALSAAVRGAVAQGYAEPHPAVDLSGEDAARKLVILLRALGQDIELGEIERVPLVESALLAEPDATRLLASLASADDTWRARAALAEGRHERWVYRASVEADAPGARCRVRLAPERVPHDHPLAQLAPCENKLVLHSAFYAAAPLVVSGPGAGIDLTAAGVLGDLARAARGRRRVEATRAN